MAEHETLVQNEVGFPGDDCHFEDYALVARAKARRRSEILVGARKRFCFLNLHLGVATSETAGAGLVTEHFGAALFAQITLSEDISHLSSLLTAEPFGSYNKLKV
jgi:hypothetical protein